jgi:hypothetical protein
MVAVGIPIKSKASFSPSANILKLSALLPAEFVFLDEHPEH